MDNNKKRDQENEQEVPERILISFNASAEEALEAIKKHLNIKAEGGEEK